MVIVVHPGRQAAPAGQLVTRPHQVSGSMACKRALIRWPPHGLSSCVMWARRRGPDLVPPGQRTTGAVRRFAAAAIPRPSASPSLLSLCDAAAARWPAGLTYAARGTRRWVGYSGCGPEIAEKSEPGVRADGSPALPAAGISPRDDAGARVSQWELAERGDVDKTRPRSGSLEGHLEYLGRWRFHAGLRLGVLADGPFTSSCRRSSSVSHREITSAFSFSRSVR